MSIKVTRKVPSKSKETIDAADDERVSASAEATKPAVVSSVAAEEADDFSESSRLEIDLNVNVSDEEKPIKSEKDGEVDVDISEV